MMFVLPVVVWVLLFKDFLNGSITFMYDSYSLYAMFKFFYNNLFNGVIPLWDPFVMAGVPNITIATSGVLNPLMAVCACLHFAGLDYGRCFMVFVVLFFLLALAGFYLVVLEVAQDKFLAWLGFAALLFSGMGPMLFNQLFILFIFCPSVWLLYFLLRFAKTFEVKYFFGMAVAAFNMLCLYVPFYFLTVLGAFTVFFAFFFPRDVWDFARGFGGFICRNKAAFVAGLLLVLIGLMPLVFYKVFHDQGDLLFLTRHVSDTHFSLSEYALGTESSSAMPFKEVSMQGTLGERMKGGRLFSHLDKYDYESDDFFYVPAAVYLFILAAAFAPFGRQSLVVLCTGMFVFLLALGQAAPLHRILYDSIFYFKYFRNFFFFMAFLIPLIILFAVIQLKSWMAWVRGLRPWTAVAVNTFLHACFAGFLLWQGNVLAGTCLTVAGSCVLWNVWLFKPQGIKVFFLLLLVLEPVQVFTAYAAHASGVHFSAPSSHLRPVFQYDRRPSGTSIPYLFSQNGPYGSLWYDLAMRDSRGQIPAQPFVVSRYTFLLSKTINEDLYLKYVFHKLYVYDRVKYLKNYSETLLQDALQKKEDVVFVSQPPDFRLPLKPGAAPLAVSGGDSRLKVTEFDPVHLKLITDFPLAEFLVWTDSYEKYWKVFLNKQEAGLYRANLAFKGLWLPPGRNEVEFRYSIPAESALYVSFLALNLILWAVLIRILWIK